MNALIANPHDISFIFENDDKTFTIGIRTTIVVNKNGKPVEQDKIISQKISKQEGEALGALMNKRGEDLKKMVSEVRNVKT